MHVTLQTDNCTKQTKNASPPSSWPVEDDDFGFGEVEVRGRDSGEEAGTLTDE